MVIFDWEWGGNSAPRGGQHPPGVIEGMLVRDSPPLIQKNMST